jgi:hypothetical protein
MQDTKHEDDREEIPAPGEGVPPWTGRGYSVVVALDSLEFSASLGLGSNSSIVVYQRGSVILDIVYY